MKYYLYFITEDVPTVIIRQGEGKTEVLNRKLRAWEPLDSGWLSRYLENGESGLDEVPRQIAQQSAGFVLPA